MNKLKELFNQYISSDIKSHILKITHTYLDAGYECWIVGGPVRDLLLNHSPKDIDFATNCPLEITKTLFQSIIPTGEDHGTLTIHIDGENYEVTRYRKDVDTDGRRATIAFANTIQEDVLRRDLTINAIAFNPVTGEVVDAVGGISDFDKKLIKFVGNPVERIKEDYLRSIRFIRFIAKLMEYGFTTTDEQLTIAIKTYDSNRISTERIYQECNAIFEILKKNDKSKNFVIDGLSKMCIFNRFIDDKKIHDTVIQNIFTTYDYFPLVYEYYQLIDDKNILIDLKLSKDYIKNVLLFEQYKCKHFNNIVDVKDLLESFNGNYEHVFKMFDYFELYGIDNGFLEGRITLTRLKEKAQKGEEEPFLINHLSIGGRDLINKGYTGEAIGIKLRELLQYVKLNPEYNKKPTLVQMI